MSHVGRNIIANFVGSGWSAIMGLVFIPLYVRYLGMEAYGLIGVFAVLQAWLTLLDMGMAPTLNREMARYTAGVHSQQSIRDLLRSVEVLCFGVALLIGACMWVASGYLASDWLKADKLPTSVIADSLSVMAVVVALRLIESIYHSALLGLQRQVWYNAANAIVATVRHGGAVAILAWLAPTLQAYFLWQGLCSLLSIVVLATGVQRALPKASTPPKFSPRALLGVWKFARGMIGISFLAILLTQVDKVLLSRLLRLDAFGYYTLAGTVASVLYMVLVPITQAVYPRLVELASQGDEAELKLLYHQIAQVITVLTSPVVTLLGFFAGGVVYLWSGDSNLAESVAPILSVLTLGTFLNGLMYLPYQLQLAHGWTALALTANITAVAVLIPTILWVVPRYGAIGAAWIWVSLNACYVLVCIQFMHRRLISTEKWSWYLADVLLPVAGAVAVTLMAKAFQPADYQDRGHWFFFLLMTGGLALGVSTAMAAKVRGSVLRRVGHALHWRYS